MQHLEVLEEVRERGLTITASGEDLRLEGPRERIDPELVGRIRACKPQLLAHLARPAEPEGIPATPLQGAYFLGRQGVFDIGTVASHVYHEIEGCWDVDRLEAALARVVARHDALRTRFTEGGRQVTEDRVEVPVGRLDLRGDPPEVRERRRLGLREERSHRVLPADRAPLLAADVTILADDAMVLHVSHDGLAVDAVSMFLLFREWWRAYEAGPGAAEEAPGGTLPLEAYVQALEGARARPPAERSRAYWLARLDDLPGHPDLPLRASPSSLARPRFTQRVVRVDAPAWADLKQRAREAGVTRSCLLLAAYAETLACWGAGARFTVTATLANRPPIHPQVLETVGAFSDTMLVEVSLDAGRTFAERAGTLQARLRRDLDHRHFSGIEVLRELSRRRGGPAQARMPFTFNSAIDYVVTGVDGSALELFGPEVFSVSQTPQVWLNLFAMEQHGQLVLQLDGVDELFCDGVLDDLAHAYERLLYRLCAAPAWSAATFDLLPAAQRARRRAVNDTAAPLPGGMLHEAFAAHAARDPEAPALLAAGGTMSYGELHRRATHAAAWLREQGAGRDELVALVMARGPEQVVGILATVMAGAAYLPVDATLPAARQRYMLDDGRVRCVLANADPPAWCRQDRAVLVLDAGAPPPGAPAAVAPAPGASPDDLAYVLYTSGTTGEPKGVMVSHRSVANVVADCNARFAVGPGDRFFGVSAFNFDLSVYDVFGALSAGAALVLPDRDRDGDPSHWLECCARHGVTVWNSVPAIVGLLRDEARAAAGRPLATLRLVMMSGDRIPPALPAALWELEPGLRVVSLGGPTETTIWNILHPVEPGYDPGESIPYGRPNANNRAYVLDAWGRDAPDWVTGEICAAGAGLARGYWRDEARTAERFFHDPGRGERLYRTGDLGRYLPDGSIAILGRSDFQLKVNGYRVEAGEVETALVALDTVRQAVVARQEGAGGDRLVAHLVPAGVQRPPVEALRDALREHLPDYMLPAAVTWHERLPLTRNGKVDRAALAAAPAAAPGGAAAGSPRPGPASDLERAVAEIWASVLGSDVSADSNLYEVGGDSLSGARILAAVGKRFGVTIPLDRLFEVETVRAMAARVEEGAA